MVRESPKEVQKDEECDQLTLLAKLAAMQLKAVRMKHVDAGTIYKMELQ